MTNENKVGREYPPVVFEIERGKIREMASAIGDDNHIYYDTKAAEANGYQDIPPVPTMTVVGSLFCKIVDPVFEDLKINMKMVLHGEERYEYLRDYYPGDVLTGFTKVSSINEKVNKSGGKMRIIEVEVMWRNQNGEDVLRQTNVLIERS